MALNNHDRAKRALAAMRAFANASRMPLRVTDEGIADLITDLLHLAHTTGSTPDAVDAIINLAQIQHRAERTQHQPRTPSRVPCAYNPPRLELIQ